MPISVSQAKDRMRAMTPYEFEEFVAEVWSARRFTTTVRQRSRDRGIDLEARRDGSYTAVQVKQNGEETTIGSRMVRNYATLYQQDESIDSVVIVTSGGFTAPGEDLARDLDVALIDGVRLAELAHEHGVPIVSFTRVSKSPIANITELSGELGIRCNEYFVKTWAEDVDRAFSRLANQDIDLVERITSVESETYESDVVLTIDPSDSVDTLIRDGFDELGLDEPVKQYFDDRQLESTSEYVIEYDLTVEQVLAILLDSGKAKSALNRLDTESRQSDPSAPVLLGYILLVESVEWSLFRLSETLPYEV
ncbi:restriction endonuclease [Halorubrum cibi]|uniref:Restriction endonuclease n=1 Tax=Halorubrum cibi TaxID=413815 RepID=A0A521DK71_9EURY|nr:restriction endonuclease [Halorubrum cibi]SMO72008.1 Restriction endonuclease [Halorubrum cibi]